MKSRFIRFLLACVVGSVAVALVVIYGTAQIPLPFGLSWYSVRCQTDDEVQAADRVAYEEPAMQFVRTVLGSDPSSAYSDAAPALRAAVTQDAFLTLVRTRLRPLRAIDNWHVVHSYYVTGVTIGQSKVKPTLCTTVAHGSSSLPEGRVLVDRTGASEQAHVIVEGDSPVTTWSFMIWLIQEGQKWRVDGFHATPTAVGGKSAFDLLLLAREQHSRHQDFNAFVLYATALQLSSRGPNLQLGIQPEIKNELDSVPRPSELEAQPPHHWRFDGVPATVVKIGPTGLDGKMYLLITQELAPWEDDQEPDRQNRALIPEFSRAHPEYTDAFSGLVIEAVERGGSRAFRTLAGTPDAAQ